MVWMESIPNKSHLQPAMKIPRPLLPPVSAAILASACFPAAGRAESGTRVTDEDLLMARNPVVIRSRVRLANEYTEAGGGNTSDKLVLGAIYGFGFDGHDRDFAIGFELPFLQNDPEDGGSDWGVGDFKLRCGQLFVDDPEAWRAGWFFDTEFDTAANAVQAIANQRTQMTLGGGGGYAILSNFVLTTTLQYGWSLEDGETTGAKREWEAHLTATVKVCEGVAVNLDYKGVLNTVGDTEYLNTLEPSVGWTLGEKKNIGLFASCEIPLFENGADWIAKAGMLWFF